MFPPALGWTHYVIWMRIANPTARAFYEIEAAREAWSTRQLERQIGSLLFERLANHRDPEEVLALARRGQEVAKPTDVIKDPFVLEFLDLGEPAALRERDVEQAIIDRLETFLLEMGKGFCFVGRQKRLTVEGDHFYVDLVFYNRLLCCFVLVDLKLGKLTHQDLVEDSDSFLYEYDFGDSWEHEVTVKRVAKVAKSPPPRCIDGARACPPEDCGGTGGYENLLKVLADPSHEEHTHLVEWSEGFQPEHFEIAKTGRDLRREMDQLKALAEKDDSDEVDECPAFGLPKPLIQAVLALEPLQRASLGAVIVGSLADELVEARTAAPQRGDGLKRQHKPARTDRKRAR